MILSDQSAPTAPSHGPHDLDRGHDLHGAGGLRSERIDRVATTTAAVCAVHCALSPIILPLLPLIAGQFVGSGLEWGFVAISVVLGVSSLWHSYRALHRNVGPLMCFGVGMSILLLSKGIGDGRQGLELSAVMVAASLIMAAHILNLRMRRRASADGACPCPCHDTHAPDV